MLIEELRYVIGVCLLSKMLAITSSSSQNKNTQKHLSDTWHGMASLTIFSSLEQNFSCSVHGIVTMTAFLNSSSQEKVRSLFKVGQVTAQVASRWWRILPIMPWSRWSHRLANNQFCIFLTLPKASRVLLKYIRPLTTSIQCFITILKMVMYAKHFIKVLKKEVGFHNPSLIASYCQNLPFRRYIFSSFSIKVVFQQSIHAPFWNTQLVTKGRLFLSEFTTSDTTDHQNHKRIGMHSKITKPFILRRLSSDLSKVRMVS